MQFSFENSDGDFEKRESLWHFQHFIFQISDIYFKMSSAHEIHQKVIILEKLKVDVKQGEEALAILQGKVMSRRMELELDSRSVQVDALTIANSTAVGHLEKLTIESKRLITENGDIKKRCEDLRIEHNSDCQSRLIKAQRLVASAAKMDKISDSIERQIIVDSVKKGKPFEFTFDRAQVLEQDNAGLLRDIDRQVYE